MKIKTKLTLNFLIYVTGILILFSATVYLFYLRHRGEDFSRRLKYKAVNTTTLLFKIEGVDRQLLKIIDDNSVSTIGDVCVVILDKDKRVIYSNVTSDVVTQQMPEFKKLDWENEAQHLNKHRLYLCFKMRHKNSNYYVLASGTDYYGQAELEKLSFILIVVLVFSIIVIVTIGYFNAAQALKPIKEIISQVDSIRANNLNNRLSVKNHDEIDELALTFNKMLGRLQQAFETERMFVSNVSHELRTPVTSIIGQLEVALLKARSEEEYNALLNSILEDIRNMKTIINGFLDLAETGIEQSHEKFVALRVDELLFMAKEDILKRKPHYAINIEFENLPEDENEVSIMGNERLIKIVITNLIDNACKFSEQHKVTIRMGYNNFFLTLKFIDNGIGIPVDELAKVVQPLYRAKNAMGKGGHGIGLSIVKRIIDLHQATLEISSEVNVGTTVAIMFPNIKTV